jgi:glycerol-3-phosphate O-acyltransferase / dihydroxyacetone phosphate acyltransferase
MWLYRAMPLISELATRAYYRVTISGTRVPAQGPVLLVANHNNSLVDPALVAWTSGRRVRFLAKSTLFTHPLIGWLVRAVGSVPVYRQQDDPTKLHQNLDSFRDVHAVLGNGDAVGIFPEGISHSAAQLAPLKTGAARIALGAADRVGTDFPIIAMGLVFRDRDVFRSEAHVIIGEPFRWDDLMGERTNRSAVRELTWRIEQAMRAVSLNLETWEDEPLVRAAEEVWRAEFGAEDHPAAEVQRLRVTTEALSALRRGVVDTAWRETVVELRGHERALRRLGLTPGTLAAEPGVGDAVRWLLPRLPFILMLPVSMLGALVFWLPREATAWIAAAIARQEGDDALVTHRVLVGAVLFPLWFVAIAGVVAARWGGAWGLTVLFVQPLWAFAALAVGERRQRGWRIVRRYVLRRMERPRLQHLRTRQRALAERLRMLLEATGVTA